VWEREFKTAFEAPPMAGTFQRRG